MERMKRIQLIVLTIVAAIFVPLGAEASSASEKRIVVTSSIDPLVEWLDERGVATYEAYEELDIVVVEASSDDFNHLREQFPAAIVQKEKVYAQSADREIASAPLVLAQRARTLPYTGRGVKVAVIDSGVDTLHSELNIAGGYCAKGVYCPSRIKYHDDNGHGTHVAGVIAAQLNGKGIVGLAPNVELYAVKAMNAYGLGTTSSLIDAVSWSIQNNIQVANLSINTPNSDIALQRVLERAYAKGMILIGSAGNNGLEPMNQVTYPARYETVIAVGAVDPSLKKLPKSAIGEEVEVVAPGYQVLSTYPYEWDFEDGVRDGYTRMSGTSMAAPHVTAVFALYRERFPNMTNEQIRQYVQGTAKDIGAPGRDPLYGYGLIQYVQLNPQSISVTSSSRIGKYELRTSDPVDRAVVHGKPIIEQNNHGEWYGVAGTIPVDVMKGNFVERHYIELSDPKFVDVSNDKRYAPVVGYVVSHGWITGEKGAFYPDRTVTRGEVATYVGRMLQLDGNVRTTPFKDVSSKHYASGYIASAVDRNILGGFPDGTFRPDQPITRAEAAIILTRAFNLTGGEHVAFKDMHASMKSYRAVQSLVSHRITLGFANNTFRPDGPMTRADIALFLARIDDERFR